jgi:hypothetical protein
LSIRFQVERIKQMALAHAELERVCARLALFERDVAEAEDLTGQPFQRGRTIIRQTRARIERERAGMQP